MLKLDPIPPSLTLPSASPLNLRPARRLIVLIPGIETDFAPVMHRVWELAHVLECGVLFLGLCRDVSEEPGLRRALITLSALVQEGCVSAAVKAEVGNDWLRVIRSNWREGDLIVCFVEHQTGWMRRPLGQILESKLKATVYILSEMDPPDDQSPSWSSTLLLWAGFAGILIGFLFLQINLDKALEGRVETVMVILTVLVEFWLVWAWNNLFG